VYHLLPVTDQPTSPPADSLRALVRRHRALILIVGVALATRLTWLFYAQPEPVSDYQVYVALAETLLDEGFFGLDASSAFWLPGYPWFLAGVMLISRSTLWLSVVSVLLATLACPLLYLVANRLTGRRVLALVAAAVFAVMPGLVVYAPVLGTEHLFIVLFLVTILMTLRLDTSAWRLAFGTGLVAGCAVLTRGEMLFYLPVVVGLVWFGSNFGNWRTKAVHIVLIASGVLVVISPWIIRNMVVVDTGPALSTVGGMNFYFGHRADGYGFTTDVPWPGGDDLEANLVGWSKGLEYVERRPVALLESARDGTYAWLESPAYALIWSTSRPDPDVFLEWDPVHVRFEGILRRILILTSAISLSLAAASFITWPLWSNRLRVFAAGTVAFNWIGYVALFFGHPRFRYTVDVVATILIAIALTALWQVARPGGADRFMVRR
jgi:4-amino-4-deoxy-L-arabinose transferase-like glycosyltransferase